MLLALIPIRHRDCQDPKTLAYTGVSVYADASHIETIVGYRVEHVKVSTQYTQWHIRTGRSMTGL